MSLLEVFVWFDRHAALSVLWLNSWHSDHLTHDTDKTDIFFLKFSQMIQ